MSFNADVSIFNTQFSQMTQFYLAVKKNYLKDDTYSGYGHVQIRLGNDRVVLQSS